MGRSLKNHLICPDCQRRARFLWGTPNGTPWPTRYICCQCKSRLGEQTAPQSLRDLNKRRSETGAPK